MNYTHSQTMRVTAFSHQTILIFEYTRFDIFYQRHNDREKNYILLCKYKSASTAITCFPPQSAVACNRDRLV